MNTDTIDLRSINKVVGITYAGRSGSYLLSNLLDGHTHLLSCPFHALHTFHVTIYDVLKDSLGSHGELLLRIIENFPYLFKDTSHVDRLGPSYEERDVGVDKNTFYRYGTEVLERHLQRYGDFKVQDLFVLIHWAYALSKGIEISTDRPSIIWQIHTPTDHHQLAVIKDIFDDFISVTIVRRIEVALDSHLRHYTVEYPGLFFEEPYKTFIFLFHQFAGAMSKKSIDLPQLAVRFEDVHLHTEAVMRKFCELLDIEFEDILLDTTLDKETYYFPKEGKLISGVNKSLSTEVKTHIMKSADVAFMQVIFNQYFKTFKYSVEESAFAEFLQACDEKTPFGSMLDHIAQSQPVPLLCAPGGEL